MAERNWSEEQRGIFGWFATGMGNAVVRARAGTGKTTTLLAGVDQAPEQAILLCAFNKRIADELKGKLKNPRAEVKTLHALGFSFIKRHWENARVDGDREWALARQVAGRDAPDAMVRLVAGLAQKAKEMVPFPSDEDLTNIAYRFDLLPDEDWEEEGWTLERILRLTHDAMKAALERDGTVSFADMLYIPVANRWVRGRYDMVCVDEAQDMSPTQLLLAQQAVRPGGRICVIGDDRQAIYGFRGADSGSLDRLKAELAATEYGLTITYRCPKTVVAYAATLVPDYRAADAAPEGTIRDLPYEKALKDARAGDFILSRTNAPLARTCLALLRAGTRARIEGKDIGKGLLALIGKLKARDLPSFLAKLEQWRSRECAKAAKAGNGKAKARTDYVNDQADTLEVLSENLASVRELEARVEALFNDDPAEREKAITCSSVHKAKGLERDRVYILQDTLYPGGRRAEQEEANIEYVAVTRAKAELVWVLGL